MAAGETVRLQPCGQALEIDLRHSYPECVGISGFCAQLRGAVGILYACNGCL